MVAHGTVVRKELNMRMQNVGLRQQDPEARLNAMRSSEATVLREFWPLAEKEMPLLISRFHDKLLGDRATCASDRRQVNRLEDIQAAHWRRLFSGRFDAAYLHGARVIGGEH